MIKLEAASLGDKGVLREENEDTVWQQVHALKDRKSIGLFVVCDGMGGHMGGRYASYWAVEAIKREFADLFVEKDPRATIILSKKDRESVRAGELVIPEAPEIEVDLEAMSEAAIQKANKVVYDFAKHKPTQAANAGTTVTMAAVYGAQAVVANVGDSRTYLLRGDMLHQITADHSLVAGLVAEGQILPDEIYTHPQRNVIFRYMGQQGLVQPDFFHLTLESGDYLLLCSDGLWEMVQTEEEVVRILRSTTDLQKVCRDLVAAANAAGGEDNISVVLVRAT